jgi:predicted dithiol-disulfide oxidoreductase (DUF899 family)
MVPPEGRAVRRPRHWQPLTSFLHHSDWHLRALKLLAAEKDFTRQRDALTRRRMVMPWERVGKSYRFEGPRDALSLADLFDGRSQLIVYHFMFAPDCKGASNARSGPTISMASRSISIIAM